MWSTTLEVVEIVLDCHDGAQKKEKLVYFMKDESVNIMIIQELLVKSTKGNKICSIFAQEEG